jgi:hypothetical protein
MGGKIGWEFLTTAIWQRSGKFGIGCDATKRLWALNFPTFLLWKKNQ